MLLPNIETTPINRTATSATRRPYSVTAIPSSLRRKRPTCVRSRFMVFLLSVERATVIVASLALRRERGSAVTGPKGGLPRNTEFAAAIGPQVRHLTEV